MKSRNPNTPPQGRERKSLANDKTPSSQRAELLKTIYILVESSIPSAVRRCLWWIHGYNYEK
jgi:hypothetical protein